MEHAREEQEPDPRSPKRQALQAPHEPSASATALLALNDAIWTRIVEFLPVPRDLQPDDQEHYDDAILPVVTTWRTLLHLRLVTKELAVVLHPRENVALWRRLLLQSFDFSAGYGFNVTNYEDNSKLTKPKDDNVGCQKVGETWTEQDPQRVAMRGRYEAMPPEYLEEDLVEWTNLGIYHRPSQYGFLTALQQQSPEGEWPASEDPLTLFGDLVRLLRLPHGDDMIAGGEGSDTTFKFLAAPAEADASSAFHRFYVMKTLGYVPHFWHWGYGIGDAWKGFTDPDAFKAVLQALQPGQDCRLEDKNNDGDSGDKGDDEHDDENDEDESESDEDEDEDIDDERFEDDGAFNFPSCTVRDAKRLYRHLHEHCQDWRPVCCSHWCQGYTPVFFVGESKLAPHRWYAGKRCWT